MKNNDGPSKVKRSNHRRTRKSPEQRARDRAIDQALAKAGNQNGPFIVRKGTSPIGFQGNGKNKFEKASDETLANGAMAEAMARAGIAPEKPVEPADREGDSGTKALKSRKPRSKRPSKNTSEEDSKNKPKAKARKKNTSTPKKKGISTASPNRGRKSKKASKQMMKFWEEMQSNLTPLELRWKEKQIEIVKLIDSIESATFSNLVSQWKKHVGLVGYIDATGKNVDRREIYVGLIAAIEREWARRSKLVYSSDEYFDWPSTKVSEGKHGYSEIDWANEGFLSYLGYHVGESSGLTDRDRHAILKRVFAMTLPPLESPDYVKSWGAPGSAVRLKKIAHSLASFARSAKRRSASNFTTAIAEWEGDLSMLREEFYVARFGFGWPTT